MMVDIDIDIVVHADVAVEVGVCGVVSTVPQMWPGKSDFRQLPACERTGRADYGCRFGLSRCIQRQEGWRCLDPVDLLETAI